MDAQKQNDREDNKIFISWYCLDMYSHCQIPNVVTNFTFLQVIDTIYWGTYTIIILFSTNSVNQKHIVGSKLIENITSIIHYAEKQ